MSLQQRIQIVTELGNNLLKKEELLDNAINKAYYNNEWFIPHFINLAITNIVKEYCNKTNLEKFCSNYNITNYPAKKIGLVLPGNIPMVGMHDLLCVFLSGHKAIVKLAQKDTVLMQFAIDFLNKNYDQPNLKIETAEMLKECDAYIATGGNNTGRYFEQYFGKYPNIIRKSKTSVAVLNGNESTKELENLALDITNYFGMGCRSVTKLYLPNNYDFTLLISSLKNISAIANHNKFKNNYDYNLALHLLNNNYYMTDGNILLVENKAIFAPIATVHYEYYNDAVSLTNDLKNNNELQCIVGHNETPFGSAQCPQLQNFADGVDTMKFLCNL